MRIDRGDVANRTKDEPSLVGIACRLEAWVGATGVIERIPQTPSGDVTEVGLRTSRMCLRRTQQDDRRRSIVKIDPTKYDGMMAVLAEGMESDNSAIKCLTAWLFSGLRDVTTEVLPLLEKTTLD